MEYTNSIFLVAVFIGQIITVVTVLAVNKVISEWLIEVQKDLRKRLPHAADW